MAAQSVSSPGSISGTVKDQNGAVVQGSSVVVRSLDSDATASALTDQEGKYLFRSLPSGHYRISASVEGFQTAVRNDVFVSEKQDALVDLILSVRPNDITVVVTAPATSRPSASANDNAAELLADTPGVSLRQNGKIADIPMLHGLGDERTKLVVNGMIISNACANHMNPPLSYMAPSNVAEARVTAGITPVSMGGDSIGGTISVDSPRPVFAKLDGEWHSQGTISGFYRSNGRNYGPALSGWVTNHNFGIGYSGSWVTADNYTDGSGHKVTSSYTQTTDHTIMLAAQGAGNLVVFEAGLHHTPYQGFTNAQMDMVRNYAESLNLRYKRSFEGSVLDVRAFWQGTWHSMNIGHDKSTFPMPMWMPMNTHGRDYGYSMKLDTPLGGRHTLRVGSEFHRFVLDDSWPAVPGQEPYMGPDTFLSINNGRRSRLAWFGEVSSQWNPKWTTLLGIRNDTVWMDTGQVSGYSDMYADDANVFNARSHGRTDANVDATALVRYEPRASTTFELGYARKTRTPNLYERYAWSTDWMASGMIGWFGDGNYYIGNLDLKPEVGHTVSASASWHDRTHKRFEVKITPYQTYVQDYIDVDKLDEATYGESPFAQLRFANHDARIYGVDVSENLVVWDSAKFGQAELNGVVGYMHGERRDKDTGLYQMMPFNARIQLQEELKGWIGGIEIQAVDRKSNVDPLRYEQITPGYALLAVHLGYGRGHMRLDFGCENLLNKSYALPLGGVNFDDYLASGWMSRIEALTGRGRSFYVGLSIHVD